MKMADALSGVLRLYFDSAPLIYYLERHPNYAVKMINIFQRVDRGELIGVTSAVTLAEVLVDPLRRADVKLAQDYRELLYNTDFETIPVDGIMGSENLLFPRWLILTFRESICAYIEIINKLV